MKSYTLTLAALLLVLDVVKALQCHQCDYLEGMKLDGDNGQRFHESCKSGKKPNKKFVLKCATIYDVCLKLVAEGQNENGYNIKYTARGCGIRAHFSDYDTDICEDKNSTVMSALVGDQLPENVQGTVCLCSGDKCNSSSLLTVSRSLLVAVLGLLWSKFMGII